MVEQAFQGRYRVACTGNCADTLAYIGAHGDLSAVVLSLSLPEDGGLTVLQAIQRDRALWDLAVVVTAAPDPELEREALDMGADDFIGKPHFTQSLLKRLKRVMDRQGAERGRAQGEETV